MELLGGTLACFLLVWVDQIPNRKLRIMKKERINTYKNCSVLLNKTNSAVLLV